MKTSNVQSQENASVQQAVGTMMSKIVVLKFQSAEFGKAGLVALETNLSDTESELTEVEMTELNAGQDPDDDEDEMISKDDDEDDDDGNLSDMSIDSDLTQTLNDCFYPKTTQGVKNPIVKDARDASGDDWKDFFRYAAHNGNKEILSQVKAHNPSSDINIKRIVNMVYKGQQRLAKLWGMDLEVVRAAFKKARQVNGVRTRQLSIRRETIRERAQLKKANVSKMAKPVKHVKVVKKLSAAKDKKLSKTKNEGEASRYELPNEVDTALARVPGKGGRPKKFNIPASQMELENAAWVLVKLSVIARDIERVRNFYADEETLQGTRSLANERAAEEEQTTKEAAELLLFFHDNSADFRMTKES